LGNCRSGRRWNSLIIPASHRLPQCVATISILFVKAAENGVSVDNLIAVVIGDIAIVLVLSALLGSLAQRFGQPAVIGQILAGILLGPSLLGRFPGHLTDRLFPHAALPVLAIISQVAIAIFMFVVGYELEGRTRSHKYRPALLVATFALLIPMGLGSTVAVLFRSSFTSLGQSGFDRSFILFMGVATSITALPVLAAIARERGLAWTNAGMTAITSAGFMDVIAWLVLAAALVGTSHQAGRPWPVTLLLITGFAAVMLLAVRPALRWWIQRPHAVLSSQLPVALTLALGSAWVTASLGLHPVFGGLLAGFTMPGRDGGPDPDILRAMEEAGGLLLPLFFVVTGLSVNVGAIDGTAVMLLALLVAIASIGKLGPAYAASRIGGLKPKDAAVVAALVNTRGLTELIALNVGLSAGIIGPRLFSVLVLMALITTLATGPLLRWIRLPAALPVPSEVVAQPGQLR
jgi:Kef-type K+ transport system membrane component KefB